MRKSKQNIFSGIVHWLNAVFILIVLNLHYGGYTTVYLTLPYEVLVYLMYFSVGGFVFLSGFKLTESKSDTPQRMFWAQRFMRIYPLYAIAVLIFSVTIHSGASIGDIIQQLLMIQMIIPGLFGGSFLTLYFISLLFAFYMFFSYARSYLSSIGHFFSLAAITYIGAYILHELSIGDFYFFNRLFFVYFVFFIAGMLVSRHRNMLVDGSMIRTSALLGTIVVFVPIHLIVQNVFNIEQNELLLLNPLIAGISIIPWYILALRYRRLFESVPALIRMLSFASFAVYLFHRPIWHILFMLYHDMNIVQWAFIILFGVPFIIFISYFIQVAYNHFIRIRVAKLRG